MEILNLQENKLLVEMSPALRDGTIKYIQQYLTHIEKNTLDSFYNSSTIIAMRRLSEQTNFKFNTVLASINRQIYGLADFDTFKTSESLFEFEEPRDHIINKLNENGYYITNVSTETCDKIINELQNFDFYERETSKTVKFDPTAQYSSNTVWVKDLSDILKIPIVQSMITDSSLLSILQEYLQATPVLQQTNCWLSVNHSTNFSLHAQKFHRDFNHEKWIKVFIYLNDVTETNGPHCFVKKSHLTSKPAFMGGNRGEDNQILAHHPKENVIYLTGNKGTVVIEDTMGLHKGVPVVEGHRLIFQLEFAVNANIYACKKLAIKEMDITDKLQNAMTSNSRVYSWITKQE